MNNGKSKRSCIYNSEFEKCIIDLIYTSNSFSYKINDKLKAHNITIPQYNVLRILKEFQPEACTANDIKYRMLEKNSDISRIISRLSQKQLLKTYKSKSDKRSIKIKITDQGIDLVSIINNVLKQLEDEYVSFSVNEIKELSRLLNKLKDRKLNQTDFNIN